MTSPGRIIPWPLSDAQTALALEHIRTTSSAPIRDELALWLAVYAGLQAYEIAGLSLSAMVDAGGNIADQITIERHVAKYRPARQIPMPQRVREALSRFRAAFPDADRLSDVMGEWPAAVVGDWLKAAYTAIGYVEIRSPRLGFTSSGQLGSLRQAHLRPPPAEPPQSDGLPTAKRASFRYADMKRAVSAAQKAGLEIAATELGSDGSIRLVHNPASPTSASAYEQWKERRDARRS